MGAAASVIALEKAKPTDATDLQTFDEAKAEVIRLRKLLRDQKPFTDASKYTDNKRKIIIVNGPCSGKATYIASYITETLGIPHLSTSELVTAAITESTDAGKESERIKQEGGIVTDQLVIQIVKLRIQQSDCSNGFVLEGFPRNLEQSQMLDEILKPERVSMVLALDVNEEQITPVFNYYSSLVVNVESDESFSKEVLRIQIEKILYTFFSSPSPIIPIKVGARIPHVIFKARTRNAKIEGDNPFQWKDISTDDLFKGKRAVVFCLPGAFNPVGSISHLPGYLERYDAIKKCGIDDVYCLSVNDAFVMRQWGISLNLDEVKDENTDIQNPLNLGNFKTIKMIPDGACLFTRGMGMSTHWGSECGFGERSWRYSVVINDNKVEKLFIENDGVPIQNYGSDPFEISDAETMLNYLSCASTYLLSDFAGRLSVSISRASSFKMDSSFKGKLLLDEKSSKSMRISQSTSVI